MNMKRELSNAPILITTEVLDRMNELALTRVPSAPLSKLDYRRAQQLLTLLSLAEYIRELGLAPQFSIKVSIDG